LSGRQSEGRCPGAHIVAQEHFEVLFVASWVNDLGSSDVFCMNGSIA